MDNKLLWFNLQYLMVCSLAPLDESRSSFVKIKLFNCLKYFYLLVLYCVWLPFLYELYLGKKSEFIDYSLTLVNAGAYFSSIITIHFFSKNGKKGRRLIDELNVLFKRKSDTQIEETNMDQVNKTCKTNTFILSLLLNIGAASMALLPIAMEGRQLPTTGEYPGFNPKNNTIHYVTLYIVQGAGQWLISNVTAASDGFIISMVLICSQQVKIISKNFHNCFYNALINYGVNKEQVLKFKRQFNNPIQLSYSKKMEDLTEDDYILQIIETNEFKNSLNELMISYIKHHQKILHFFDKMGKFLLPVLFIKVAVSIFYHVFIIFACLSTKEMSLFLILVEYEMCAFAELLIFGMAGQALINESEKLNTDLIQSPWYICDLKFQKLFYMVLIRSRRVSSVSIGKLANMSLPTFLLIMKTAFSYLAVLRQVVE